MRVYRLSAKAHQATAFSGDGARLAGGRWNHKGQRMVYCSESRALAAMELFVNLDPRLAPSNLVFITADVPDDVITAIARASLPANWHHYPAPDAIKDIGTEWLDRRSSAALLVPSAIVPEEHNLLLNPEHADFARIALGQPSEFNFDGRMWKGTP